MAGLADREPFGVRDWRFNHVPDGRPVDMEWNHRLHRWQPVQRPVVLQVGVAAFVHEQQQQQQQEEEGTVVVTDEDHSLGSAGNGPPPPAAAAAVVAPEVVGSSSSVAVADTAASSSNDNKISGNSKKKLGASSHATAASRCLNRCGSCPGCLRDNCGKCHMCQKKKEFGGQGSTGACIHRPCDLILANREAKAAAAQAQDKEEEDDNDLKIPEKGDRVYSRWPVNDQWYLGTAVKKYDRNGNPEYTVHFDDGDKRKRVPIKDIVTEADYDKQMAANKKRKRSSGLGSASSLEEVPSSDSKPSPRKVLRRGAALKKDPDDEDGEDVHHSHRHRQAMAGEEEAHPATNTTAAALHHRRPHHRRDNDNDDDDDIKKIGDRVYARFGATKSFYWGKVTSKSGQGEFTRYSIEFEDGDKEDNVAHEYVFSPSQCTDMYDGRAQLKPTTGNMCHNCPLCLKDDCGTCQACVSNGQSTHPFKYCCLFKTCKKTAKTQAQSVPGLPAGWTFFFVDPAVDARKETPIHPKLAGLRVVPPPGSNKTYRSLESAILGRALTKPDAMHAAEQLYEKWLGLKIRIRNNTHELIGKRFCRQWLGVDGKPKMMYGRIISCEQYYFWTEHLVFTVEYEAESRKLVDLARGFDAPVMDKEEVSERLAWGGYVLFQETVNVPHGIPLSLPSTPHIKWLLPDMSHRSLLLPDDASNGRQRPGLTISFRGYRLVLEARKSAIPNAGLGVFLTVHATLGLPDGIKTFVLKAGDMLDLGLYAPLSAEDIKEGGVGVLKNFIHKWQCEAYAFDISGPDNGKKNFDITDDLTSELHDAASQNVQPFVNETDGEATPTVHAMHDPHGSVHYMLGHEKEGFQVPLGKEIELKIDYGSAYERVRVREQYSRLSGAERKKVEHGIKNDDSETLQDIDEWSVLEVEGSVKFLETLQFTETSSAAGRSLIAAVLLLNRLFAVKKEFASQKAPLLPGSFCDNGYSSLSQTRVVERAKTVVLRLLNVWKRDMDLEKFCHSEQVFVKYMLSKAFVTTEDNARKLNGRTIRCKIQDLCKS